MVSEDVARTPSPSFPDRSLLGPHRRRRTNTFTASLAPLEEREERLAPPPAGPGAPGGGQGGGAAGALHSSHSGGGVGWGGAERDGAG